MKVKDNEGFNTIKFKRVLTLGDGGKGNLEEVDHTWQPTLGSGSQKNKNRFPREEGILSQDCNSEILPGFPACLQISD